MPHNSHGPAPKPPTSTARPRAHGAHPQSRPTRLQRWEAEYNALGWATWLWMVAAFAIAGAIALALLWLRWAMPWL